MAGRDDKLSAEDRLIANFFKPLATHPGALGLTDDAAFVTPPPGCDLVLKTDAIIGGVHFFPDDPADLVARKALRVNLSDLAAKGAKPLGFLVSLALPKEIGEDWLGKFAQGLRADAEQYGCPLFGGDTDRTPGPITIADLDVRQRAARHHGTPRRRQARRPRAGERQHRRCRAWLASAQRRRLEAQRRPAPAFIVALSAAAAAQCIGGGGAPVRFGVDGRLGWAGRRSRQARPRLGRGRGGRGRARSAVGGRQGGALPPSRR